MALFGFGLIFLAFGLSVTLIELLAVRYGTRHELSGILMLVCFGVGGILAGAGLFLNRSAEDPRSNP
jgi:hypothetical protein